MFIMIQILLPTMFRIGKTLFSFKNPVSPKNTADIETKIPCPFKARYFGMERRISTLERIPYWGIVYYQITIMSTIFIRLLMCDYEYIW